MTKPFQLFLKSGSFLVVSMDNLGPPEEVERQFALLATDRYSKLTSSILTSKTTLSHIVSMSLDKCIIPLLIPMHLMKDNGTQLVISFFKTLRTMLRMKCLRTTACHHHANGKAERFNKTAIPRPRHYCMLQSISGTETFMCSRQCMRITPRCIVIRVWSLSEWSHRTILLISWHSMPWRSYWLAKHGRYTHTHHKHSRYIDWKHATRHLQADETAQQGYKCRHNRRILHAPQPLHTGLYVYIDCPPMKSSAAECLAPNRTVN